MSGYVVLAIIIALLILEPILMHLIRKKKKQKKAAIPDTKIEETKETTAYRYRKRYYLLTKNEHYFYKTLLPITNEMQLTICPKVRLADIVEPCKGQNIRAAFNKIQSKHIDFLLCKDSLSPALAIELDDNSHEDPNRINRDTFVNSILEMANIPIIHVKGPAGIEEKITQAIKEKQRT